MRDTLCQVLRAPPSSVAGMSDRSRTGLGSLCLIAAAVGALILSSRTAPSDTQGDWWDSPLFIPSMVAVGAAALGMSYHHPRRWPVFGLAAVAPYWSAQIAFGVSDDSGLWVVGLVFLVPLSAIPVLAAWSGAAARRSRGRRTSMPDHRGR